MERAFALSILVIDICLESLSGTPLKLSTDQRSSASTPCGNWFAWATMAVAAC